MQTLEFTRSLRAIVSHLKVQQLVALLTPWLSPTGTAAITDPDKDKFYGLILESHSGYDHLLQDPSAKKIMQGLNLADIYDTARLRRLTIFMTGIGNATQVRANAELYGFYELLKSVLRVEQTVRTLLEVEKVGNVAPTDGVFELELIDYDGNGVELVRLQKVVEVVLEIHMNLARLLNIHDAKASFRYFDSGSDVLMAIQSAKALIESMGTLFLQFWNKTRFRGHETFAKDMEALSQGLDFMSKVQASVEAKAITSEEAEILKARVFRGVDELVRLGATLPFRGENMIDQRQLLIEKRDVKLLGVGETPDTNPPEQTITS